MHHFKRYRNTVFKILLALAAFYVVFSQVDMHEMGRYLRGVNPFALIGSFAILLVSQCISAERMRYYYIAAGQKMSHFFALALYFVGMLYNLILPGGIGGDGYKIYILRKLTGFPHLTSFRLMLSNRASGLFLLMLYTFLLAVFSHTLLTRLPYAYFWLAAGAVVTVLGYFISVKLLLREKISVALQAAKYSAFIQGACVVSAYLLFAGMDALHGNMIDYLMVFMISSIVSVIPISVGGAGLREVTFLYASNYLGLDVELGVAFSLIYFIINALCALCGLFFTSKLATIPIPKSEEYHGNENARRADRMESA